MLYSFLLLALCCIFPDPNNDLKVLKLLEALNDNVRLGCLLRSVDTKKNTLIPPSRISNATLAYLRCIYLAH